MLLKNGPKPDVKLRSDAVHASNLVRGGEKMKRRTKTIIKFRRTISFSFMFVLNGASSESLSVENTNTHIYNAL